ncbi:unnamed protein product [Closterium sp. Naga37s-1]|nr:unnamed protein product [Closterium sp. Naga37s-1]
MAGGCVGVYLSSPCICLHSFLPSFVPAPSPPPQLPPSYLFSDTSADGDFSDDEDYSDADADERSVFGGKLRAAKSASCRDGSKKSAWSNALSSRPFFLGGQEGAARQAAAARADHGDRWRHAIGPARSRRHAAGPLCTPAQAHPQSPFESTQNSPRALSGLKPTRSALSSAATGGAAGGNRTGAAGGGSKRHRDGVMEDDDVAMGDASLAPARAAELALGRRIRSGGVAGGGGGDERGGAGARAGGGGAGGGAGGGGGRKKAKANSGQAIPSGKDRRGGKKQTGSGSGWSYTGDEYAAGSGRRAGGDVKKEGKLEPHAYSPLDAKMLNRRAGKLAAERRGMTTGKKQHKGH